LDYLDIIPARQTPSWGLLWLRFRRFGRCRRPNRGLFRRGDGVAGGVCGEQLVEREPAF
jgi:hypothetical protein